MKNIKTYLIIVAVIIVALFSAYIGGCQHGKKLCTTDIVTNTVIVHDTLIHQIVDTFPYYIQGEERIIYRDTGTYHVVDTAYILRDYFATHITDNIFQDSLLKVDLQMHISENQLMHSVFKYRILRPQEIINTTVDKSVHYYRYVYFGTGLPVYPFKSNNNISNINYIQLEGIYAFPKGYVRAGWQPYTKQFNLSAGVKIFKFRE